MNPFMTKVHQQIETLIPYQAGQSSSSLKKQANDNIIKLASNENPLGVCFKAKQAMQQAIEEVHLYPEQIDGMLNTLARHLGINSNQCLLGCGSENIIAMLIQVFNQKNSHILIPQYGFSAYRFNAQAHNAAFRIVATANMKLEVSSIIEMVTPKTNLIFIDNPNNPVGYYLTHNEIEFLLKNIPSDTILVLDEAYYEYARHIEDYPDSQQLQKSYPNLFVLRTFSKVYGLAGLRIGYGFGSSHIVDLLNRVRFPFNVSNVALAAANAALSDQSFVEKSLAINQAGLAAYQACFEKLNLTYTAGLANFITVDLKQDAMPFFKAMLEQGIIFRPLKAYNLDNFIRISIGNQQQNQRAIEAINHYFGV